MAMANVGGGSFWQGKDGLTFGPGYQLKDGVTTVHKDVVAKPALNEAGQVSALETSIGSDSYSFTFAKHPAVPCISSGHRPTARWVRRPFVAGAGWNTPAAC